MRHIRLETRADEYDSTPGFVIKGQRDFDGIMADREARRLERAGDPRAADARREADAIADQFAERGI